MAVLLPLAHWVPPGVSAGRSVFARGGSVAVGWTVGVLWILPPHLSDDD